MDRREGEVPLDREQGKLLEQEQEARVLGPPSVDDGGVGGVIQHKDDVAVLQRRAQPFGYRHRRVKLCDRYPLARAGQETDRSEVLAPDSRRRHAGQQGG